MIAPARIEEMIRKFEEKPHPDLPDWYLEGKTTIFPFMRKRSFLTLEEALKINPLYLSHNGFVDVATSFDILVSFLGLHPDPSQILVKTTRLLELRGLLGSEHGHVRDCNPKLLQNLDHKFYENLLGLQPDTFTSYVVEAGYGMRVDSDSELGRFMVKALAEQIPVFIRTVDLERGGDEQAYIINGFDI